MRTRDRFAAELRKITAGPENAAIYEALAVRAETGEFDDFGDAHDCPVTALYNELIKQGLTKFASRVANGEFDATADESEEWARSQTDPEMIKLMDALGIGPRRDGDQ